MNLSTFQRRFLIVWILFNSIALFVNVAKIKGEFYDEPTYTGNDIRFLFTGLQTPNEFWPFTVYNSYVSRIDTVSKYQTFEGRLYKSPVIETQQHIDHYFNGIFNSYDLTEYVFYIILGLGIVFIPKLWSERNPQKDKITVEDRE